MPKTINGKEIDEEKWAKAKEVAAKEGRSEDYAYIMGIYKRMVGMAKSIDTSNMILVSISKEKAARLGG